MVEALVDSYEEIVLNGIPMKTRGPVADTNLSVFSGKVVTGDYTKDSNPTLSAWVISDLSGGLGVEEMNEGVDQSRYRLGTLYARSPGQIAKGFRVRTDLLTYVPSPGVNMRFLGDLKIGGTWDAIMSYSTAVIRASGPPMGTMTVEAVNRPVTFQGTSANVRIVVPMGASGYALISDAPGFDNVAADATHPALQAAVVWDNKLVGIDTSGQLWWTINPGAANTWASYGATAKLPTSSIPRTLATYFDRQGLPAVFVVSDTEIWQFDPNGPELFQVDVSFPNHPYHGMAATRWGGDLYFTVAMGVHRYTGGSLSAVGLDRDHGLPFEYSGYISDLVPGYNALYALVIAPDDLSSYTWSETQPTAKYSVHEYTGTGWHMLWESSSTETAVPQSMGITRYQDKYRLAWGVKNTSGALTAYMNDIVLPRGFTNPRQRARVLNGFAPNGWLETSIFDAGMKGYNKLANALDVSLNVLQAGASLAVTYKIDGASSWTTLGTVTATGTTSLPFGTLAAGIYPGKLFERIQFRFDLTDSSDDGFIMESAVLSYIPIKPSAYSFNFDLDLTTSHGGLSPQDIIDALNNILEAGVMVPFVLRGTTYRVFLSQVTGSVETGADESAYRRITLLQIPQTLGAG